MTAAIAAASGVSVAQASPADDQATADAAIAAFNERLTEAGGISSPAPDITPIDPAEIDEYATADPTLVCFGDVGTALDPGGRFEGETARAFSDDFTLTAPDAPVTTDPIELAMADNDHVNAAVITVGDAQVGTLDELIEFVGSDAFTTCFNDFYAAASAGVPQASDAATADAPPMPAFEITADSDIGVGDSSVRLNFSVTSTVGEEVYVVNSSAAMARTGRTLVFANLVSSTEEPVSDVDLEAELTAIVDSL